METPNESDDDLYLVWSVDHDMWWKPLKSGYTTNFKEAGRYTRADAIAACGFAKGWLSSSTTLLPVRECDVLEIDGLAATAEHKDR